MNNLLNKILILNLVLIHFNILIKIDHLLNKILQLILIKILDNIFNLDLMLMIKVVMFKLNLMLIKNLVEVNGVDFKKIFLRLLQSRMISLDSNGELEISMFNKYILFI